MKLIKQLKKELKENTNQEQAEILRRFFKTGKGEYGEGDIFLGVKVPIQRKIAKKYLNISLGDLENLLSSKIHEHRFIALVILVNKFNKFIKYELSESPQIENLQKEIFDFYIKNSKRVNNWDLVDVSAPHIVGRYLLKKGCPTALKNNKDILVFCRIPECKILYKFAKSENLWEKRIAIVSTFAFIREGQFDDTLKISEILLSDNHDLIHKAVGWMLREVGNRERKVLEKFLKKNYKKISRTTLRYAIEKFPEDLRQDYLKGV